MSCLSFMWRRIDLSACFRRIEISSSYVSYLFSKLANNFFNEFRLFSKVVEFLMLLSDWFKFIDWFLFLFVCVLFLLKLTFLLSMCVGGGCAAAGNAFVHPRRCSSHWVRTKVRNSSRVLGSSRNVPNMDEVTVLLLVFCTPRITMHMCLQTVN